ncbi:MAG: RsmE family RNA methyltransferase [Anaerovoracaceae bacterium]|jgi:16S rRNA (uracil1498-N3)-methyltransferase|nr:RsmE family RNA methyltransferase [Anaerovoracaceae bacterium]
MNRFFVEGDNIQGEVILITQKDDVHHIFKVLRLQEGDLIRVSDNIDSEYKGEIISVSNKLIEVKILEKSPFKSETELRITLFQGIPKQGKMEIITQKCTELGMDTLVPVFMERTVVVDKGDYWKKVVRCQAIAEEAAKQSQRGMVPEIRQATTFQDMLSRLKLYSFVLFPYEEEKETTIKEALKNLPEGVKNAAIIIGPEGGFTKEEAIGIIQYGGIPVSLGKTILRTETAGIVAMAMTFYEVEMD